MNEVNESRPRRKRSVHYGKCQAAFLLALGLLGFDLLQGRDVLAQQSPGKGDPVSDDEAEMAKEEARRQFNKGLDLLREQAWSAALAAFMRSRELYPTRNATNNSAVCLRKLQRYDEALDMFELLLRDFPDLPPEDKLEAQRNVAELREWVGTIDITDSLPGATIVIDGRSRGDYPPVVPLRVAAGGHIVRVFKEGYEPFEGRVDVAGGNTIKVVAKLHALKASGILKIVELTGKPLEVYVDNILVGLTPWEGTIAPGRHIVVLRGQGDIGTVPAVVVVKRDDVQTLSLRAEHLESFLRIEPIPAGARVSIDAVLLGNGISELRLRPGVHRLDVTANGYISYKKTINVARGERKVHKVELQRDPTADVWKKPSLFTFDFTAGLPIVPSFGGDVAGDCGSGCSRRIATGGLALFHAGYQLGWGLGFGVSIGYFSAAQSVSDRKTELTPVGLAPVSGTATDDLRLHGLLVGGALGLHIDQRYPIVLRLGAGALTGWVRDWRSGAFALGTEQAFHTSRYEHSVAATWVYIDPEVRAGMRIGERWEAGLGLQMLLLIAPKPPRWNKELPIDAGSLGLGQYSSGALTGSIMTSFVPGFYLRYGL